MAFDTDVVIVSALHMLEVVVGGCGGVGGGGRGGEEGREGGMLWR